LAVDQKRLNFRIPTILYDKLVKVASKRGCNLSEVVRDMLDRQLCVESLKADEDMIREYIKAEIDNTLAGYMDRIIAINVKSAIASASSWILSGRTIERFVPPHLQEEYHEAMNESHKGAYAYISTSDVSVNDIKDGSWINKKKK